MGTRSTPSPSPMHSWRPRAQPRAPLSSSPSSSCAGLHAPLTQRSIPFFSSRFLCGGAAAKKWEMFAEIFRKIQNFDWGEKTLVKPETPGAGKLDLLELLPSTVVVLFTRFWSQGPGIDHDGDECVDETVREG